MRPILSLSPLTEFKIVEPVSNLPEYILANVSEPTKGSLATLNANAEKGSSSDAFLTSSSSFPGMLPVAC